MPMNPEELRAFLEQSRVGIVASIRKSGSPHLTPVWYRYDGRTINIWTDANRVWVRNLQRDSRVAFAVYDEAPPFAGVVVRGRAEVTTSPAQATLEEARNITRRYIEEQDVEGYLQRWWPQLQTIVRIHPETITSWREGS